MDSSPKRQVLPIAVLPGIVGKPISIQYLTVARQQKLVDRYLQLIHEVQTSEGTRFSQSDLNFECDYALAQIRAAARVHLSSSPNRRSELSHLKVSKEEFEGSYGIHWEDLVHTVSPFDPCY
jgi:hypothetical protein